MSFDEEAHEIVEWAAGETVQSVAMGIVIILIMAIDLITGDMFWFWMYSILMVGVNVTLIRIFKTVVRNAEELHKKHGRIRK